MLDKTTYADREEEGWRTTPWNIAILRGSTKERVDKENGEGIL